MRPLRLYLTAAAIGLASSLALAGTSPEVLLPPGFDNPRPAPSPNTTSRPVAPPIAPAAPVRSGDAPTVAPNSSTVEVPRVSQEELSRLPTIAELESMSTDELDDLLGLKPKFDIPPAARRSLDQVGLLSSEEGGFQAEAVGRQPASLVRAALKGTKGPLVSRWGHILMRRALASRLESPEGMDPVEFAALRIGVLNRMGEFVVARSVAQTVDTSNWSDDLISEAVTAYLATSDIVGICPAVRLGFEREGAEWQMLQAICNAYAGETVLAKSQLDRAFNTQLAPAIDVLLAQRFAGAAGLGRRAVDIEWEPVEEITPWRFAFANALGEPIPDQFLSGLGPYYQRAGALGPMIPLEQRASYSSLAAQEGILSSAALIDLYSQIYNDETLTGEAASIATQLRQAYVGDQPAERMGAIRSLWSGGLTENYDRYILTAYASARLTPSEDFSGDAGELIASMLSAGLTRDAQAWGDVVEDGSLGWALLALIGAKEADNGPVDTFVDDFESGNLKKAQFLIAGLAGLGELSSGLTTSFSGRLEYDLERQTRWTRAIEAAAEVENAALVAMLAGLGMQGDNWSKMTPLHLYHIVRSLNRVGLTAEARMIAAEAVARG